MRRTRLLRLVITMPLFALATNALSMPAHALFNRDSSSCAISGHVYCSGSGLPSNFCCAATSTCLILASNTTLICCPEGESCNRLVPVTCNVSQLNATSNPSSELLTTDLDGTLPTCGAACCPYGYSCFKNETCIINSDQNPSSTGSGSTSTIFTSVTATATSISIPSATTSTTIVSNPSTTTASSKSTNPVTALTASSAQTSNSTTPVTQKHTAFTTKAILTGLFSGLAAGVIIAAAVFFFLRTRRRKAQKSAISGPIYYEGSSALRTDFLRRSPAPQPNAARPMAEVRPWNEARSENAARSENTGRSNPSRSTFRSNTLRSLVLNPKRKTSQTTSTIQRVRSLFHRSNASSDTLSSFNSNAPVSARYPPPGFNTMGQNTSQPPSLPRPDSMEEIEVAFEGISGRGNGSQGRVDQGLGADLGQNGTGLGLSGVDMRGSHQTSFSDMMRRADLGPNEPFVPGYRTS